ncbi:Ileal sodium/bile acid cotransporter [Chionoecetes opilio]|uniref:Ileal sodium/bile acid cotransporter n=1 Tax=Chionoecetes opilio TaxID=41210 RepID=A0A8J5CY67_CHIOP|nr:Ileal sodium/bile acid cotransporter [Chionoecetes opilio]
MACNTVTLMLGMGAAISVVDLWHHTKRPIGAVIGMVSQFLVLPAIGFCLSMGFKLRPYEALGVLMISCSPGGSFSNFFTFWVDGDLALSIMMTVCSSLLAFGGMPFNLWLYGRYWHGDDENSFTIPFGNIVTSLVFVSGPVVVGMAVRHYRKRAAEIITKVASLVGWLGVIAGVVIWSILYWQVFVTATPLLYLAAILLPLVGFIFAFTLAKLACQNNKIGRTIGVETSSQNISVAASIILLSFQGTEVKGELILFPTLYGVFLISEAVLGILAFQLYKRFYKKDKDQPPMHTARLESATPAEKETLRV